MLVIVNKAEFYATVDLSADDLKELLAECVTNGAIVIHTQRLKSDPGGNLLS